jgi:hypothetical protein
MRMISMRLKLEDFRRGKVSFYCNTNVVPAHAGTHNPGHLLLKEAVDCRVKHIRRRVWVPAQGRDDIYC